ncbi:hypothetical protein PM082_014857 [Marasmius tenuissimus]|nr:hypothetical protein PM082_014857 [Marasmius tenuissimus]
MASEEEIAQQVAEPFTSSGQVIVFPIATFLLMFLVYGMYTIIFGLSINVLWSRHETPASKTYMRWIIALFILITINIATTMWIYMNQTPIYFNAVKTNNYIPLYEYLTGKNSLSVPTTGKFQGIAPTVIVIRIAYGETMENVQQMISTLQFAEDANNSQQQSIAACGTVNLQQSLAGVEERGMTGRIELDQEEAPLNMV